MKIRIISAAVGVPLILLTFAFHSVFPLCINILCAFASLCCAIELINAKKWIKDLKLSVPCMLFASLLPMSVTVRMFLTVLVFFILYIFMLLVTRHREYDFSDISYICTAIGLSAFGISCVVFVSLKDEAKSCFYITLCLAIAWISDAGAYFVGSFLGKKKLCPEISPKKTVEGAVGGVIIGVAGALADALVFQYVILGETVKINFVGVAVISLIGVVFAMFGDLTFSIIKRSCKVKDYGNVIPGHGGILDRCDSIIMTAPLLYIFLLYFPLISLT